MSMPLGFVEGGKRVVIQELACGKGMCQRLTELGLNRGTKVGVVKNDQSGPVILSLDGSRLALGRGMALKIMVDET